MRIEVVLLVYDRPRHSGAVLDSLVRDGVQRIRVFMDGAATPVAASNQRHLRQLLDERADIEIDRTESTANRGVAGSVYHAVTAILAEADAVIVLEDDCVVRRGGMSYFREALEAFRDTPTVRSVCGYRYPCAFTHEADQPFLLQRFCPWGWATWRDRWKDFEPDLGRLMRSAPATNGSLPPGLAELASSGMYRSNAADIWSVSWAATHYLTGTFAAYPPVSLIDNIGFDGSGRHCTPTSVFATPAAPLGAMQWDRVRHLPENDQLVEAFLSQHRSEIYPAP